MATPRAIATRWVLIGGISGFGLGMLAQSLGEYCSLMIPREAPALGAVVGLICSAYAAAHEAFGAGSVNQEKELPS
jgi:hypothetical protein